MNLFNEDRASEWVRSDRYAEICALFDEVDAYIERHPILGFGMFAVRAGMDAIFSEKNLTELRARIVLSAASGVRRLAEDYIDWRVGMADVHANYEG